MFKGYKLYSILFNRCPKCNEGKFFKEEDVFTFVRFGKINDSCSVCHEDFRREVGFYYGALYASYALTVAYGIGLFLLLVTLLGLSHIVFLIAFVASLLVFWVFIYRLSRLIWINLFVKYNPHKEAVSKK